MSGRRRTGRAETNADDWEQLKLLVAWPEQARYELIRPIVLFDLSPAQRARETGEASERTLYRKAASFDAEGMESLFDAPAAKRRKLPPSLRRLIVDRARPSASRASGIEPGGDRQRLLRPLGQVEDYAPRRSHRAPKPYRTCCSPTWTPFSEAPSQQDPPGRSRPLPPRY